MHSEHSALHRVKNRLARFGEKLRKEGEDGIPGEGQQEVSGAPSPPPRHLLRHILHRGSSVAAGQPASVATESGGDSDSELGSMEWTPSPPPSSHRSMGAALSDTDGVLSCESEEEVPHPRAVLAAPHLTALLLAARANRGGGLAFGERAATVAECSVEASLMPVLGLAGLHPPSCRSLDEGTNSAPEISTDQTGLLEKLGQRIRQRSDRMHRVTCVNIYKIIQAHR